MPQLTLRGIGTEQVETVSGPLAAELAVLLDCPEDYFTFDCLTTLSFFGGRQVDTAPFIDVLWFDRGTALQDQTAAAITAAFEKVGVKGLEICFRAAEKKDYYGDGVSYART